MTTTVQTPAATRPSPDSMRGTSLTAGLLYLTTTSSIPTLTLYDPVREDPDFLPGAGSESGVRRAALFPAVATLPIAVWEFALGLYLVVKGFGPAGVAALPSGQDPR